ncbi:MAG TPA: DNA-binding protein WhiA, partial [Bacteroides sp.]|nr:DNA-binding protein WhiA [Bacteroides sp.]
INACNPVNIDEIKRGNVYEIKIDDSEQVIRILQTLKVYEDGRVANAKWLVNPMLIQMTCCKRAFIRGAFLASGSISDPNKFYHLEIVCDTPSQACQIRDVMNTFGAEAKVIQRKKYYVVYVKEGTQISDLLNVMEAGVALMNFENVRIVKEMRNSVNRQVNCETANLNKTVSAAVRQIEDIERIRDTVGLEYLAPGLRAVAIARLENPDMNLKDLGEILDPPVGKSGVNHRLRKIGEIAAELSGGDI